jgi:capsular exopolysaccharide synthesis family protein
MPMTYDLNLREYWRTIRKRKFIVIYTIVMLTVFSFITAILGRPTPAYQTSASVKVEKMGSVAGLYLQAVSMSTTNYMETQMAMIKSYFILELVAKKMGRIPADLSSEAVRNNPIHLTIILDLKDRIKTEQEGNSDIITITASSQDPREAQRLANTVAQVYQERHGLELNRRTIEAKKFIESQLQITREKLQKSEEAIKDFRERHRMVSVDAQSSALVVQLTALQTTHERDLVTLGKVNQIAKLLARAEDSPLSSKTVFYFEEASAPYKSLNDRLVQLMLERDLLLINYTDDFPQVVEIKKQIREIVAGLQSQLAAQSQALSQTVKETKKMISRLDDQLHALPAKGLELARLERDASINKEISTLLEKQYQESQIQHAEKLEEVQIVKPALEPTKPINPPKTAATTALGFLLGLILGVVFAFVIETFDTSIGAVEEVEEFLGARVLGVVPHIDANELKANFKEKMSRDIGEDELWRIGRMITHFAPKTTAAESYRALRTNINFVKLQKEFKTIVFTSSSPQEGKTTISINLAIAMAQAGQKVLLIDGDFRRPVVSKIFGIPSVPGLTDVILGNYKWREAVRSITDLMMGQMTADELMVTPGLDNLFIMPSGTIAPNPAELVNTKVNRNILNEVHGEYDFVIIDAPPVLAATDAVLWGTMADGVIIVYQVGKIARGALKRAKSQLDNVKASVIGVVLNGLKAEISPDYEYHDKYYYYYGSERKKKLTLGERIASLPERVRRYAGIIPGKAKSSVEEPAEAKPRSGISLLKTLLESRLLKIVLLLLALGLLAAGLYYSWMMTQIIPPPSKPGIAALKPPPPKAAAVPMPVTKPEVTVAPGAAALPSPQSDAAVSLEKNIPNKPEALPSVVPDRPEKSFAVQVRATQDDRVAKDTVVSLKSRGHDAFNEKVDLKEKGTWHRIFIGRFASENEARKYIATKGLETVYPDFIIRRTPEIIKKPAESGSPSPARAPLLR